MDILDLDRAKMTIYGSDFQQVNLTPNGGVSPTVGDDSKQYRCYIGKIVNKKYYSGQNTSFKV